MQTGSLVNQLSLGRTNETPAVGTGATELCWSDRHAFTVVEVLDAKTIVVQRDAVKRIDSNGMSDAQTFEFSPNVCGHKTCLRLTPKGWVSAYKSATSGRWITKDGRPFAVGYRSEHYDYSF